MKLIRAFSFFLLPISVFAQSKDLSIIGTVPNWPNSTITLGIYDNHITKTEVELVRTTTDKDGKFSLTYPNGTSGEYILKTGKGRHDILLEPGHTFEVLIPDPDGTELYYPTETDTTLLVYQIGNLDFETNRFAVMNYEEFQSGKIRPKMKSASSDSYSSIDGTRTMR